ncbi:MAG: 4Fe-4S binding protein, partial [Thermodesulfobacteriota bacterium]
YDLDAKPQVEKGPNSLQIKTRDHILQQDLQIEADLLVLASAIVRPQEEDLAGMFKLPLNAENFFMEAHAKLRPVEFATDGIFLAGLAHYPKPLEESISQAKAAASRAAVVLCKDSLTVEGIVSEVNEFLCRACGECVEACPYNAIELVTEHSGSHARVQTALCKGCGACAVACPTGAAALKNYEDQNLLGMVQAALEQEDQPLAEPQD